MIDKNVVEDVLESLTLSELDQVRERLINLSKENNVLYKIDDYKFIESNYKDDKVVSYTNYCIKLAVLMFGFDILERMVDSVIKDKFDHKVFRVLDFSDLQTAVIDWRRSKSINDPKSQFLKVVEEFGEIQQAKNEEEFMDAIGDTLVTLIILNDILQRKVYNVQKISIAEVLEEDLYRYIHENTVIKATENVRQIINTDVIAELGKLAECISKITKESEYHYIEKSYIHIQKIVRYVVYIAQIEEVDFLESLEFAYNTISKRTGKTVDGVFIKEEDL